MNHLHTYSIQQKTQLVSDRGLRRKSVELQGDEQRSQHRPRNNQGQRKEQHGTLAEEEPVPIRKSLHVPDPRKSQQHERAESVQETTPAHHNS